MAASSSRCLLLCLLLAPAAAHAEAPAADAMKLAVLDLRPLGADESSAATVTQLLAVHIAETGLFQVVSRDDLRALLSHEQDKRMLGAEADPATMAKLGDAVGARYLVAGSLSKLGDTHILNAQLIATADARVLKRVKRVVPVDGSEDGLGEVKRAAFALVQPVRQGATGFLSLRGVQEGTGVYLDDQLVATAPVDRAPVPGGLHALSLKREGFVNWAREVEIRPGEVETINAVMTPSQAFIDDYDSRASTMRWLAWSGVAVSALSAGAATWFYLEARDSSARSQSALDDLDANPLDTRARRRAVDANEAGETQYALYWTFLGTSVVAAGAAAVLFAIGDPPGAYDHFRQRAEAEPATIAVTPTPAGGVGLSLTGGF